MPEEQAVKEASRACGPGEGIPAGMEVRDHRSRYWLSPLEVSAIGTDDHTLPSLLFCFIPTSVVFGFPSSANRNIFSTSHYFAKCSGLHLCVEAKKMCLSKTLSDSLVPVLEKKTRR